MKRRWMLILAAVLALSLVAVACGDDDDDDGDSEQAATTEGPAQIEVTAGEYFFEPSEVPESSGPVTMTLINEGAEAHQLLLAKINEGFTLDEAFEAQGRKGTAETIGAITAGPGQTAKQEIKGNLTPGHYAMVCPFETKGVSHFEEGQQLEFDVE